MKNYHKLIKQSIKSVKCINFYDNLDWNTVKDRGVWTDVYLHTKDSSVFAFCLCSSFAARKFIQGSVPEMFRDLDSGIWSLYIHKQYITQNDVGKACKKWFQLQGRVEKILGTEVIYNKKNLGFVSMCTYPENRIVSTEDKYKIESYLGSLRNIKGGPCS